jgi:hypothetical protein
LKHILPLKVAGVTSEVSTVFEVNEISGYQPLNWLKKPTFQESSLSPSAGPDTPHSPRIFN